MKEKAKLFVLSGLKLGVIPVPKVDNRPNIV